MPPPSDLPPTPNQPDPSDGPDRPRSRPLSPAGATTNEGLSTRLDTLSVELADHRSETRSEIGHLTRLVRAEGLRLSRELSREVGRVLGMLDSSQPPPRQLTLRNLVAVNLASVAIIVVLVRLML